MLGLESITATDYHLHVRHPMTFPLHRFKNSSKRCQERRFFPIVALSKHLVFPEYFETSWSALFRLQPAERAQPTHPRRQERESRRWSHHDAFAGRCERYALFLAENGLRANVYFDCWDCYLLTLLGEELASSKGAPPPHLTLSPRSMSSDEVDMAEQHNEQPDQSQDFPAEGQTGKDADEASSSPMTKTAPASMNTSQPQTRGRSTTMHQTPGSPNARSHSITVADGNDTEGVCPAFTLAFTCPCVPPMSLTL